LPPDRATGRLDFLNALAKEDPQPMTATSLSSELRVTNQDRGTSPLTYARVAGLLYLIIFIMAPFAEFFVRETLIVPGDAAATAANILASEPLFRAGFASDLVVFVIEVAQAAVLYVLLRPVSRVLALVMSFARLAQATILGLNLLNMFMGLQLLTGAQYAVGLAEGQRQALALMFLNAQGLGYELGLVFFALHLGVLGYLVHRSGFLPRFLGILLVGSALGYVANSFALFLMPGLADVMSGVVIVTALFGELPLTIWLLIKGVNAERWHKRERASAAAGGLA
jgi:hypothetical protein